MPCSFSAMDSPKFNAWLPDGCCGAGMRSALGAENADERSPSFARMHKAEPYATTLLRAAVCWGEVNRVLSAMQVRVPRWFQRMCRLSRFPVGRNTSPEDRRPCSRSDGGAGDKR